MDAELNPAQRLHALGQSLWRDSINRVMLRTGALARYVRDLAVADAGIDADALAEHLQRHGAGAFTADWAALLTAIKEKAAKLTQHARGKMDEGSSLANVSSFRYRDRPGRPAAQPP
jgi:hypothetical protein